MVEGPGDAAAIPILIRRIAHERSLYDFHVAPRPKSNLNVGKLLRAGEIERFVEYCRRDPSGDCVLIALDCEDIPLRTAYSELHARVLTVHVRKPTAIVVFEREFEVLFLYSIEEIISSYPEFRWDTSNVPSKPESIRGMKEHISSMMPKDKAYKETRDQPKFSSVINLEKVRRNASFCQLEAAVVWLSAQNPSSGQVFSSSESTS